MTKHSLSSYAPDDARIAVQSLEFLRTPDGTRLRERAAALLAAGEPTVAAVTNLRKTAAAPHVHAALILARLQEKAAGRPPAKGKFHRLAYAWATPESLEQSTGTAVAAHKARRFAAAAPTRIYDLCAGIGGDTMELAQIAPTTAVELSPTRAACLQFNLTDALSTHPVDLLVGNLFDHLPTFPKSALFHIDPSRRAAGRRSPHYEDLLPGPPLLAQVIAHFAGGALKLSSAVDFDSLPLGHLELISYHRSVSQAVLWTGTLASPFPQNTRTATILSDTHPPFSLTATPTHPQFSPEAAALLGNLAAHALPHLTLYELDGALTRAGLAAQFAKDTLLHPLTSDGGYLLAQPSTPLLRHIATTPFLIHTLLPFSEKRVADALRLLPTTEPSGPVEVKSRGNLPGIDTDSLQLLWSKAAPARRTVLLFRWQDEVMAAIGTRIP